MLQRFVANWLRQHAQEALMQGFQPEVDGETDGEPQRAEPQTVDIACFFPASNQAAGLIDLLSGVNKSLCHGFVEHIGKVANRQVAIIEAALPHEQLALVVRDVISLRKPSWVLASGFAMAMDPSLARGHLLIANRLVDAAGYSLAIDAKMQQSKGLHVGTVLTVSDDDSTAKSTDRMSEPPAGVLAQESQAAVIGEVCRVLKTKMMAVHCIASKRGDGDDVVTKNIKSQDSIAGIVGAAAGALIEKPSSIKDLWHNKEATLIFADRLAKFLVSLMSQLPYDGSGRQAAEPS